MNAKILKVPKAAPGFHPQNEAGPAALRVGIIGLGYVGATCAAGLARLGHTVHGVDLDEDKVDCIAAGRAPIVEPGLDALMREVHQADRVRTSSSVMSCVSSSDISMICVGTPSRDDGALLLDYVLAVAAEIGAALRHKPEYHCVVVRSTVTPGTVRNQVIPVLEAASGKRAGVDFGVCMNPEFLREGTAINDFFEPSLTVVGEFTGQCGERLAALYARIDAPVIRQSLEMAEMIKYVNNAWHANKVAFANEVGTLARAMGIDGREVMKVVCEDTRLNVSSAYMQPGFAFGGSCLPKDLRALNWIGETQELDLPLLNAILPSNQAHIERALELVQQQPGRNITLVGLSFKSCTDDLRESPFVALAERLLGKGYRLQIYDPNVATRRIVGSNRAFIETHLPHLCELLSDDLGKCLHSADVVILGNPYPGLAGALAEHAGSAACIDLCGVPLPEGANQQGICW